MTAITTREPEIPTLSMDPSQLSLSGLIEQFGVGDINQQVFDGLIDTPVEAFIFLTDKN